MLRVIAKIPASWETARNPTFHPGNFSGYHPKKLCAVRKRLSRKSIKIYPWVCGRCSREFVYSNLRELTVHHIDHDHTNNPEDGGNWELLCLYCHVMSIRNTPKRISMVRPLCGEDAQKDVGEAKYNPFADLKAMMNKKK